MYNQEARACKEEDNPMLKPIVLITVWLIIAVILGQMQGMEDVSCVWLCLASFYAGNIYHHYRSQAYKED